MNNTKEQGLADIAIIIPVYNAKRFIKSCIKSILAQSFKNWRIIAVDDGSTDGSSHILDKLSCDDDRIFVIHQKNKGSLEARKTGVLSKYATECKWITFVDSDDLLPEYALERLYSFSYKHQADFICGAMERIYKNFTIPSGQPDCFHISEAKVYTHEEFVDSLLISFFGISNFPVSLWGKLYKSSYIQKAVKCTPKIKFTGDDLCITIQVATSAQTIVIIPDIVYRYRIGGGTTKVSRQVIDDFVVLYNFKKDFAKRYAITQNVEKLMDIEMVNIAMEYFKKLIYQWGANIIEVKKEIKRVCGLGEFRDSVQRLINSDYDDERLEWFIKSDMDQIVIYYNAKKKERIKTVVKKIMYKL